MFQIMKAGGSLTAKEVQFDDENVEAVQEVYYLCCGSQSLQISLGHVLSTACPPHQLPPASFDKRAMTVDTLNHLQCNYHAIIYGYVMSRQRIKEAQTSLKAENHAHMKFGLKTFC